MHAYRLEACRLIQESGSMHPRKKVVRKVVGKSGREGGKKVGRETSKEGLDSVHSASDFRR